MNPPRHLKYSNNLIDAKLVGDEELKRNIMGKGTCSTKKEHKGKEIETILKGTHTTTYTIFGNGGK